MKKLLLVEDDLSLIEGLKFSLEKNGFKTDIARTLREAEALFSREEYQIVKRIHSAAGWDTENLQNQRNL